MPADEAGRAYFVGSGAATTGDSVPDPADWLGARPASQALHLTDVATHFEPATSTTGDSGHLLVLAGRNGSGDGFGQNYWISAQTGNQQGFLARIRDFDDSVDTFRLQDQGGGGNFTANDQIHIFAPNNCFSAITEEQARTGLVDYRCVYFYSADLSSSVANWRLWIEPLHGAGCRLEVLAATITGVQGASDVIASTTESPVDSAGRMRWGTGTLFANHNRFKEPTDPTFRNQIPLQNVTVGTGAYVAVWLKRTVPANSRPKVSAAFALKWITSLFSGTPSPLEGAAVLSWDIAGPTPSVSLQRDRNVRISGGARYTATVLDSNGNPVVGQPVLWELTAPAKGSLAGDNPVTTGSDGKASVTYRASTDTADEGSTDTVEAVIAAGDET